MSDHHARPARDVYDHEHEEPRSGRRRRPVADWGVGEDMFEHMPRKRVSRTAEAPRRERRFAREDADRRTPADATAGPQSPADATAGRESQADARAGREPQPDAMAGRESRPGATAGREPEATPGKDARARDLPRGGAADGRRTL